MTDERFVIEYHKPGAMHEITFESDSFFAAIDEFYRMLVDDPSGHFYLGVQTQTRARVIYSSIDDRSVDSMRIAANQLRAIGRI